MKKQPNSNEKIKELCFQIEELFDSINLETPIETEKEKEQKEKIEQQKKILLQIKQQIIDLSK